MATSSRLRVLPDGQTEVKGRLVVELTSRSAADLAWLVESEELNKTTLVNRALQLYKLVVEAQRGGAQIQLLDDAAGTVQKLIIL